MSSGYEYQSDFAKRYVAQGKAEGRAEGEAKGEAKALLHILAARKLTPSEVERERIVGCTDLPVIAKGSSDKEVNYNYDDIRANAGLNYYRLKLLDKDGKYQYSNIELLTVNIEGINVTAIYPTPFTDKVNVVVSSETRAQSYIDLFDNTGKLLISQRSVLNKGVTNLSIDNLDRLATRMYHIKVQAGGVIVTKRIIK